MGDGGSSGAQKKETADLANEQLRRSSLRCVRGRSGTSF